MDISCGHATGNIRTKLFDINMAKGIIAVLYLTTKTNQGLTRGLMTYVH
jgi:hypothetical protein